MSRAGLSILLSILAVSVVQAGLVHVGAVGGPGGNTVNAETGSSTDWFIVAANKRTDGLWGQRGPFGIGLDVIYENYGLSGGDDDSPTLKTTITDLKPGRDYHIWVDYLRLGATGGGWGGEGQITAGLSLDQVHTFTLPTQEHTVVGGSESNGFSNGNRRGLRGYLGQATADADGQISAFVTPLAVSGHSRTWYDGLSYLEIGPVQDPTPVVDAVIENQVTVLAWAPSELGNLYHVYVGKSELVVAQATPQSDVFAGTTTVPLIMMGTQAPGAALPDGLEPGQTYYWRVDAVNDANPQSPWTGDVWNFTVASDKAWKPVPADGALYQPTGLTLSWTKGKNALFHTIYFGDDLETVSGATDGGTVVDETSFRVDDLEPGKTYYWRVDAQDLMTSDTLVGDVWQFTVASQTGGLLGEYFNNTDFDGEPALVRIDPGVNFDWGADSPDPNFVNADNFTVRWSGDLQVPFSEAYSFHMLNNHAIRLWINGTKVYDYWLSNPGAGTYGGSSPPILLEAGKHVFVAEFIEYTGAAVAIIEWESPSTPRQVVPRDAFSLTLRANQPGPSSGSTGVDPSPRLRWKSGQQAAAHDIYIGGDLAAVAAATLDTPEIYQGRIDSLSFAPGDLQWDTTYYWRVDEVNEAHLDSPWQGNVWSFTTANYLVVDDFENYSGIEGDEVWLVWVDGFAGRPDLGGSIAGHVFAPYVELGTIFRGKHSLPLQYNNTGSFFTGDGQMINRTFSKVERVFDPPLNWRNPQGQELTTFGLRMHGAPSNAPDPFFVEIEDSEGQVALFEHPDPNVAMVDGWIAEWTIDLDEIASQTVDLTQVQKLRLGVGDPADVEIGGTGILYIDDLRVFKPEE